MVIGFLLFFVILFLASYTCHLPGSCFNPSILFCPHIFCPNLAPANLRCAPYISSVLLWCSSLSATISKYSPTFLLCTWSYPAPSSTFGLTADFQSGLSSLTASVLFSPIYGSYCIVWRPTSTRAGHST